MHLPQILISLFSSIGSGAITLRAFVTALGAERNALIYVGLPYAKEIVARKMPHFRKS